MGQRRRTSRGGPIAWVWSAVALALLADAVRLRRRLARFPVLPTGAVTDDDDPVTDWAVMSRAGTEVSPTLVRQVAGYAATHGLDVVDVVPADLSVPRAMTLLRDVEPSGSQEPLALGRGAAEVIVARRGVLDRARLAPSSSLDRYELIEALAELKCHAPRSTGSVVAPGLFCDPSDEQDRAALRALNGDTDAFPLGARGLCLAALSTAPLVSRRAGGAALASYSIAPAAVFAGSDRLRPRDRLRFGPTRLLSAIRAWLRLVRSEWRSPSEPEADAGREEYAADFVGGTDRLLEPRRDTCPWCGGSSLDRQIITTDLLQAKPGTFSIDQCTHCGHVFQNPRLSIDGLDIYYRDFYDGRGSFMSSLAFGAGTSMYHRRAQMVATRATPKRWLDVGTGHAHFCLAASELLPDTTFDGLDMTTAIEDAERRGWVSEGHRGLFPELAPDLAGRYDAVSMHHYLEHTREPFEELGAASTVLQPGGHLMIEGPDPESGLRRVLGRFWVPWFQPQHQHMPPLDNLETALRDLGFEVVAREFDGANVPLIFLATMLWANNIIPSRSAPWTPQPTLWSTAGRSAVLVGLSPLFVVAGVADAAYALVTAPFPRAGSGAYRVLAVKTGEGESHRAESAR